MTIKFSAMILSAGFGKRLLPLTKKKPKPLIDINGITLLENSINMLIDLGCDEIIINTHYLHKVIEEFINIKEIKFNIKLIHEFEILDTAGGVKNAASLFNNENIIVVNSDIFWQSNNIIDIKNLLSKYVKYKKPSLLLTHKKKSNGLNKLNGDFILSKNKVLRYNKGNDIIFYAGLQIFQLSIFKNFSKRKFSFNEVWDYLINKQLLYGFIMKTEWYHVGDIHGLRIVRDLET